MKDDIPQVQLSLLKESLNVLKSYALPAEVRLAVLRAIRNAELLSDYIIENRESYKLAALYEMSQLLGTSLDIDEVLNQVMDAVIEHTRAERGFLVLLDPDTGALLLRAGRNIDHVNLEQEDMQVSNTVIRAVIESGEGVVTTDAQTDPRFASQDSVIIYALRSILCAPLRTRGNIIGVVYVENRSKKGIFTDRDLEMLMTFATQAAIAIENAHLYMRTDQALNDRVAELETLTLVDRQLNAQLDLKRIVEITHHWARIGTQAEQSWMIMRAKDENFQVIGDTDEPKQLSENEDLAEYYRRVMDSTSPASTSISIDGPHRLSSPIIIQGESKGVLIVERSTPFRDVELQFLERLTGRASKAIENALLYQEVQQSNDAMTKFISVVTHEMRIPMASIHGYADLMLAGAAGPTNEQQQQYLEVINNNIERIAALVSDLADISRIERGQLKIILEPVSIPGSLHETIRSLVPELDEKSYQLDIDLPEDLPDVLADPNRLVQVLTNLISNALKYSSRGGQIKINAHMQGNLVCIEVGDDGIGISPEDQTQLFTQFFRSEDQAVRDQQGWGLGLNVSKSLVNLMGGEIGFTSKLGEGSIFWFTLPAVE